MALSMTPNGYLPTRHPKRRLAVVVAELLRYSFEPISWDYDCLTERERVIIGSPEVLARLRAFTEVTK